MKVSAVSILTSSSVSSGQGHLRSRGGAVLLIKVILILTCHNDVNVDDGSIKIFRDLHIDVFYR